MVRGYDVIGVPSGLLCGLSQQGFQRVGINLLSPELLPPAVSRGRLRCIRARGVRLIKD